MGILLLTKVIFALMIGFILSLAVGIVLVPTLRSLRIGQTISEYVGITHKSKNGVPTFGGLIFIIPTLVATFGLLITDKMTWSTNLGIILLVFIGYAFIGFLDDLLSFKRKNNIGLTSIQKLFLQIIIA